MPPHADQAVPQRRSNDSPSFGDHLVKKITLVLGLLAVACGSPNQTTSSANGFPGVHGPAVPTQQALSFSEDLRPVDGDLVQIDLKPADGKYEVSVRTAGFDHQAGKTFDKTDTIGTKMVCKLIYGSEGQSLDSVTCSEDDRAVDGDLNELTLKKGDDGVYSAKLRTQGYDHLAGKSFDKTSDLADNLKLAQ
jgi:hypothetical protein